MALVDYGLLKDRSQNFDPTEAFRKGVDLKTGLLQTKLAREKINQEIESLQALSEAMKENPTITEDQSEVVDNPEYPEQKTSLQGLSESDYVRPTTTLTRQVQRPETDQERFDRLSRAAMVNPTGLQTGLALQQAAQQMQQKKQDAITKSAATYLKLTQTYGRQAVLENWDKGLRFRELDPFFKDKNFDPRTLVPDPQTGNIKVTDPQTGGHIGTWAFMTDADGKQHVQFVQAKDTQGKEFNAPANLDQALARLGGRYGYDYSERQGREKAVSLYGSNPEFAKEVDSIMERWKTTAPPFIVQLDSGIQKVDRKPGGTATAVKTDTGDQLYKNVPEEAKSTRRWLIDNIRASDAVSDALKPGIAGPITGRARKFGAKYFSDEDVTKLQSRIGQLRTIVYGFSGKQINESELKWLKDDIIPQLENPGPNFETKLKELDSWLKRKKIDAERDYPALRQKRDITAKDAGAIHEDLAYMLGRTPEAEDLQREYRIMGIDSVEGKRLTAFVDGARAPSATWEDLKKKRKW